MLGVLMFPQSIELWHGLQDLNMCTDVNTCDCTQGLYWWYKRVCTESWLWEKSLAAPGNWACVSGVLVRCCTISATSCHNTMVHTYTSSQNHTLVHIILHWSTESYTGSQNFVQYSSVHMDRSVKPCTILRYLGLKNRARCCSTCKLHWSTKSYTILWYMYTVNRSCAILVYIHTLVHKMLSSLLLSPTQS